nr:uncharacterized protein CI109_004891 [Kwoniella shandongensis]KAA5526688.1 hypothetical protein CI109_004891 [Kwoniella shandongensis]
MSLLCDHDIPDLINEHPDARAFSFQELLDYLDGKNDDADEMSTETPALTMEARNDEPLRELRNTEDWFRWLDGEEEGGSQSASGSATIPEVEPEAVLAEREDTAIDRLQDEVAAATQEYNDKLWLVMSLGEDW